MHGKIREKADQNEEIAGQVAALEGSVGEQLRVQEGQGREGSQQSIMGGGARNRSVDSMRSVSSQSHGGGGGGGGGPGGGGGQSGGGAPAAAAHERKMRALVTQRKLQDISKAGRTAAPPSLCLLITYSSNVEFPEHYTVFHKLCDDSRCPPTARPLRVLFARSPPICFNAIM
jgi:hypothetical protein